MSERKDAAAQKMPTLEVCGLGIDFGGLRAVDEVSFTVRSGEIAGLIGPNGAGKTTVFNLLTGVYAPTRGSIRLCGRDTRGLKTCEVNRRGIARTFQNIRLFQNLTVEENVLVGLHNKVRYSPAEALFRMPRYWKSERAARTRVRELLSLFGMQGTAQQRAGSLPYGAQRRLEIVRALATDPKLLLLDEPAAGMNPSETAELMDVIRCLRDRFSLAVLLIEHDMSLVMGICEHISVLNYGRLIAAGTPEEMKQSPVVIEAYLGKQKEA